jgi:hypothetical protein
MVAPVFSFFKKDLSADLEKASGIIQLLEEERTLLKAEVETLATQIKSLKDLQVGASNALADTSVLDEKLASALQTNEGLIEQVKQAQLHQEALQARITELEAQLNQNESLPKQEELQAQLQESQESREEIVRDRQRLWEEYQKLAASRDALQVSLNELESAKKQGHSAEERSELEQSLYEERLLINQMDYEIADHKRENALLQIQSQQAQEELITYQRQIQILRQESSALSARWSRLERRMPNYIDFGGLEVVQVDSIGVTPQIVWRVSDFFQAGLLLPQFYFRTSSRDGVAGIGLVNDLASIDAIPMLVPGNITSSAEQVELFRSYSTTEWQKINAALLVLEQLINNKGLGLGEAIQGFDFGFWKQSLSSLITDIRRLPQLLRFERVKLKREMQNPDYEHLWLEFYGLEFGNYRKPKLEFRLGAAMIQPSGFSRFPKLEFPLVDGVHKPFESWFAESYDDHGGKYELRFSLDQQAFDLMNWLKLSPDDRLLLQSLILALPSSIASLAKDKVAILRPWGQWVDFSKETAQLFRLQLQSIVAKMKAEEAGASNNQAPQVQQSNALVSSDIHKPISVSVVKNAKTNMNTTPEKTVKKTVKKTVRNAAGKRAAKA